MSQSARAGTRSRIRSWILWAVLLGSVGLSLAAVKSYGDLRTARSRERELSDNIEKTRGDIDELSDRIHRLRHDPTELERLARQELGLVRPGDVVIILPRETPRSGDASGVQSTPPVARSKDKRSHMSPR